MAQRKTITSAEKAGYHHGDLRQSLINAATQLVEQSGADCCTLKEASRIAGVSVAAPYRHFSDKAALLIEVASQGFHNLHMVTVSERDKHPSGSIEGLIAMGQAYVKFANDHQHLFRLMFELKGEHSSDMIEQASSLSAMQGLESETGFQAFLETVLTVIETLGGPKEDLMELAMPLWSMVHGAASLLLNEGFARMAPDTITDNVVETTTRFFFDGYKKKLERTHT